MCWYCVFSSPEALRKVDIQKTELEVMILKECDGVSMVDVASRLPRLPGQLLRLAQRVIFYNGSHEYITN
jgi:hypothetical protein